MKIVRVARCGPPWAVYGIRMASALKTTVYLDQRDYEHLKEIARAEGRAPAELVREAVAQYTEKRRVRRMPGSIAAGHSRRGDVAERAEELLAGLGRTQTVRRRK
jgi:hypothetical protein